MKPFSLKFLNNKIAQDYEELFFSLEKIIFNESVYIKL